MFEIMSRYFWIVAIVVTGVNVAVFKARSARYVHAKPELAEGYATLIRGYLIWMNVPWVVMGFGCTVGGIPTVWHYFRPQDGNPYVLAWFASVFLLWIAGTYWLFLKGGAETLVKHPGAIHVHAPFTKSRDISSSLAIKLLWCACLLGGILGVAMMWSQDIPLPI